MIPNKERVFVELLSRPTARATTQSAGFAKSTFRYGQKDL